MQSYCTIFQFYINFHNNFNLLFSNFKKKSYLLLSLIKFFFDNRDHLQTFIENKFFVKLVIKSMSIKIKSSNSHLRKKNNKWFDTQNSGKANIVTSWKPVLNSITILFQLLQ